jgi:hypothetical protein
MPKTNNEITVIFTLGTILQRDVPEECCQTGRSYGYDITDPYNLNQTNLPY